MCLVPVSNLYKRMCLPIGRSCNSIFRRVSQHHKKVDQVSSSEEQVYILEKLELELELTLESE